MASYGASGLIHPFPFPRAARRCRVGMCRFLRPGAYALVRCQHATSFCCFDAEREKYFAISSPPTPPFLHRPSSPHPHVISRNPAGQMHITWIENPRRPQPPYLTKKVRKGL